MYATRSLTSAPEVSPQSLRRAAWMFGGLLAAISPLTANPLLTAGCGAVVPMLVSLLWRPGEPPVLLLVALLHWLQAATRVFHADVLGVSVNAYTIIEEAQPGPFITPAIWLTLLSVLALSIGFRLGAGSQSPSSARARTEAWSISVERIAAFYVLFVVVANLLDLIRVGGLVQIVIPVQQLRYGALFMLGYVALSQKRGVALFLAAVGFEVITGLAGFFSVFKLALFVTFLVIVTVRPTLSVRNIVMGILVVGIAIYLAIIWTAVKEEYRNYLSGGLHAQVVTVDTKASLGRFTELASSVDIVALETGAEALVERIAYVDFFGFAINNVPRNFPHAGGAIWWSSIEHIMQPRILFPGKPPLESQTDTTRRYTGISLYATGPDSSISIGYPGLSYVDLSVPWMFLPIVFLGFMWGLMYRYLANRDNMVLLGYGIIVALFLSVTTVESSPTQLVGATVMGFIVSVLLFRFGSSIVWSWLVRPAAQIAGALDGHR